MGKSKRYLLPSTGDYLTASRIKKLLPEQQIEIMRNWFEGCFEPPDVGLPYDSSEGGFYWGWGGPIDPKDALQGEFESYVFDTALDKLSSDLSDAYFEWSPKSGFDVDQDYEWALRDSDDPFHVLMTSLEHIEKIAKRKRVLEDIEFVHQLLFANIITAMEIYLGDAFSRTLFSKHDLLENFVSHRHKLQAQKIPLSKTDKYPKSIDSQVRDFISKNIWHRLNEAKKLYKEAFDIEFPLDLEIIHQGINHRHDIVHRNGKTKQGVQGVWVMEDILRLNRAVLTFAGNIDVKLKSLLRSEEADSAFEPI